MEWCRCGLALSRSYAPFPGVTVTTEHSWEVMLRMRDLVIPGKDLAASCFTMKQGEVNVQLMKFETGSFCTNAQLSSLRGHASHHQNGFRLLLHKDLLLGP